MLAERQLEMIRRMAALDPPPAFIGGFAEDALLAGTVLRIGIAAQGSFGELSQTQISSASQLREAFFPGRADAELAPAIELLR